MLLPLPTGEPVAYLKDGFHNRGAAISPDGRWVAYSWNESGLVPQIVVRSFPDPTRAKYQVSGDGGTNPRWRSDGRELYFLTGSDFSDLRAVTVSPSDDGLRLGTPAPLFVIARFNSTGASSVYDVFPDGQRFVVAEAVTALSDVKLTVALNWMNDLKK